MNFQLQKSPGQLFVFPRRGRLTGTKPNDGITDLDGLARLQGQVPDDSVALVQQADNSNPVGHGRNPCLLTRRKRRLLGAARLTRLLLILLPAAAEQQPCKSDARSEGAHFYSGFQAS